MRKLSFFLRANFADGNLKERMLGEDLPAELQYRKGDKRTVYACSEELIQSMFEAGAQIEMIDWTPGLLRWRLYFGQTPEGHSDFGGVYRKHETQGHGEGRP